MRLFRRTASKTAVILCILVGQVLGQLSNVADSEPNSSIDRGAQSGETGSVATDLDLRELVDDVDLDLSGLDLKSPLSTQEQDMAMAITDKVKATEWLGALGPVAVSPFFGLTCLSTIAILGEDRLPPDHYLRRASSPLRNPLVLLTFLVLTILTSIPKFSKVSKPFAQAMDQLETYSAIVILLVIRVMGGIELGPDEPQTAMVVVHEAGVIEFSAETLLMLATVVNIIVINTVKFFFEVLIWITPVPFIDAIFEASNKAVCAALAAVYAFSPTIATIINLTILACCLLAFAWVKRREVFYRTILFDFIRSWWNSSAGVPPDGKLTVFPKERIANIPPMARCELSKSSDGWLLRMPRWFRPALEHRWSTGGAEIEPGMLKNRLLTNGLELQFGKRSGAALTEIASSLEAKVRESNSVMGRFENLSTEMA